MTEQEYVRDDQGQFASTGGAGGKDTRSSADKIKAGLASEKAAKASERASKDGGYKAHAKAEEAHMTAAKAHGKANIDKARQHLERAAYHNARVGGTEHGSKEEKVIKAGAHDYKLG